MTGKAAMLDAVYRKTVLGPLYHITWKRFASHLHTVNHAHLVMLNECGIIATDECRNLASTLKACEARLGSCQPEYTGEHEDYYFMLEHELIVRAGNLGGMLAVARSRNDVDHTVMRLELRKLAVRLIDRMIELADTLAGQSLAEKDTLVIAYTHGQPAQPSTYGHYLAAVLEVLLRDIHRLDQAMDSLDLCPMGAAAITTTGFKIDRERMAELLGFRKPQLNSYGCIAAVDHITGLYSAIRLMFLHLGRVVQDFNQWTSFELGQLHLPDDLVQVSSIMPQKRNPVPIEHLRHLGSTIAGMCDMMIATMHNTPFTDMNDSEYEVQNQGFAVFDRSERVVSLFETLLEKSTINQQRAREICDDACITITELADTLVRDDGLDYRTAHGICARTARQVSAQGEPLGNGYEIFCNSYRQTTGRKTGMSRQEYIRTVDPMTFISRRDRTGGPAPGSMMKAHKHYRAECDTIRHKQDRRIQRYRNSTDMLDSAFDRLAGS